MRTRSEAGGSSPTGFGVDLELFGNGLEQTLVDPNFSYQGDDFSGVFSKYALSGVLLDGTDVTGASLFVQNGTGARFALMQVPEPGNLALVGLGIAGLLLVPRQRRDALLP